MSFAKLKELIGDNAEAVKIVDELESTSNTNIQTINNLEKSVGEIQETRDKYKSGNSLVKSVLGLDQINEDTLKEFMSNSKGKGGDEKLLAEIDNLKNELATSNSKYDETVSTYNGQIRELKLGSQLDDLVGGLNIIPEARGDAKQIVKSMMSYDSDNNPIFLNEDGTTKYIDGKPMGLNDAVKSLEATRPYMFAKTTANGGGSQNNNGGGQSFKDMSEADRIALFKSNPTKFNELKQQG